MPDGSNFDVTYVVKGWCAGIVVFIKTVKIYELDDFLAGIKEELLAGDLKISYASNYTQIATEICCDVYENGIWRRDLSVGFKQK